MTKTENDILERIFKFGIITVSPDTMAHKTARKYSKLFGWIERETVVSDSVVYQYRINTEAFNPEVFNNGEL